MTQEQITQYMNDLVAKGRVAQKKFENDYTDQRAVDEVVRAIGYAVTVKSDALAQEAVDETGMGNIAGKKLKAQAVTLGLWNYMKGRPALGVVDDFSEPGIKIMLKPMGVIGAVMPSTNPIATAVGNAMMALKGRNAIIVAAHPASAKTTYATCEIMREALKDVGAPVDLVQCIEFPSIEMTTAMMRTVDANIATGGAGMVKAVYSSGKPGFGVGQGNCQSIIDLDFADLDLVASSVVTSRSMDNGVPCVGEQMLHVPADREQEVIDAMVKNNAYYIGDAETVDKLRKLIFPTEIMSRAIVGKTPHEVGKMIGMDIPTEAKVLFVKINGWGMQDDLCHEILCPIVRYVTYTKFEDAVAHALANLEREGAGHSSALWSTHDDHIEYAATKLPVSRFHVNQPTGGGGNGLCPAITIGCGTWGGNSISENLQYFHLLNKTRVTTAIKKKPMSAADWDDYDFRDDWGTKLKY